jgi:zinc protease
MSFFSLAQRHRFSLLILSLWVIAAFSLNHDAAFYLHEGGLSTTPYKSNPEKSLETLVTKETANFAITMV